MIASSQASGMKSSYRPNQMYHKKPRAHVTPKTNLSAMQSVDTQSSSSTINQADQHQTNDPFNRLLPNQTNDVMSPEHAELLQLQQQYQQQQQQQQTSLLRYLRYNLIPSISNLMKSFKKKEG